MNDNLIALTWAQRRGIEGGAPELNLNDMQIARLRRHGLLAEADETRMHPAGAFCLAPSYGRGRRKRFRQDGTLVIEQLTCRYCGSGFTPARERDRSCSPVCVTGSRQQAA